MDQTRKDTLKKGIDVTLYPLPFRKGGKIKIKPENKGKFTASAKAAGQSVQQHASSVLGNPGSSPLQKKRANFAHNAAGWKHAQGGTIGNKSFGDKTIKPGIEMAGGGKPPVVPISGLRSMKPGAVAGDTTKNPLASAFVSLSPNGPPKFKNKEEHDAHHKAEVVKRMQRTHPGLFNFYNQAVSQGRTEDADNAIMGAGGIPVYTPPPQMPGNKQPTDWKNLGFAGSNKKGGYQYNAGQGKPAKGSVTNSGLGMRKSKFNK